MSIKCPQDFILLIEIVHNQAIKLFDLRLELQISYKDSDIGQEIRR